MSEKAFPPRPGSLRSFVGGVVSLLLTRAQLAALEAEELQHEILSSLLYGLLALLLLGAGLMACMFLLWAVLPAHLFPWVMGGLASLLLLSAIGLLWRLQRYWQQRPPAFSSTLEEVRKDWAALYGEERE